MELAGVAEFIGDFLAFWAWVFSPGARRALWKQFRDAGWLSRLALTLEGLVAVACGLLPLGVTWYALQ